MCRHALILLPLVVATLELAGYLIGRTSSVVLLALLAFIIVLAPKGCRLGDWKKALRSALICLVGALASFLLANNLDLGPLMASAVVGLLGTVVLKEKDQLVVYLGTFIGMSSALRFPTLSLVVLAGLTGGILWEMLSETWNGVGGRLGTVAATAVLIVLLAFGGGLQ
ncbi:MAG TPA: hypothetical protein GXZ85_09050 [Firmicutes bacterium]|nr:hypothetical protein [Bacillota bacterium]